MTTQPPQTRLPSMACVVIALVLSIGADAAVYTWVDEDGNTHYSDQKPLAMSATKIEVELQNIVDIEPTETNPAGESSLYVVDDFRMPRTRSNVAHRFSLTSGLNNGEPRDRLSSIDIGMRQKSLFAYVKLIGVEKNRTYSMRFRVLDAKNELMFDQDMAQSGSTNSMWFSAKTTPATRVDASGTWTFQGILDGRWLFVEKRHVDF